jgi:hypothetical protein
MLSFFLSLFLTVNPTKDSFDPCQVYGKVFELQDPTMADFIVYIEESEAFADVLIYEHDNPLYADRPGQWAFVENRAFANVLVYFETNKSRADFSIAFIDTESFAGCNR